MIQTSDEPRPFAALLRILILLLLLAGAAACATSSGAPRPSAPS